MIKSVYVHIPFCSHICSYCDFPKIFYSKKHIKDYLDCLKNEINSIYQNDVIDTLYIGGGTPTSLDSEELKYLFEILKVFKLNNNYEWTVECNLENLTEDKLKLFKEYGVNRLSIGIQTFNRKNLDFLNRKTCDTSIIYKAKELGFNNINVDLIYAIPDETIEDLKFDLEEFLKLDISHISTYSLMIEENTILAINKTKPIDQEIDYDMYKCICDTLEKNGYIHYEISNFSRSGYESKHNLTYWNNNEYYGFGMGASSYINDLRITNTKSLNKYLNKEYIYDSEKVNNKLKMEYEMILGLRKIEGIDLDKFKEKYHKDIREVYDIDKVLKEGKLIVENNHLKISKNYLYLSNEVLINFVGEE